MHEKHRDVLQKERDVQIIEPLLSVLPISLPVVLGWLVGPDEGVVEEVVCAEVSRVDPEDVVLALVVGVVALAGVVVWARSVSVLVSVSLLEVCRSSSSSSWFSSSPSGSGAVSVRVGESWVPVVNGGGSGSSAGAGRSCLLDIRELGVIGGIVFPNKCASVSDDLSIR